MVQVIAFKPTDMDKIRIFFGDVVEATSTTLSVASGSRLAVYTGEFSIGISLEVEGTIQQLDHFTSGSRDYRVTMDVDAREYFDLVDLGNTDLLVSLLLNGPDTLSGSSGSDNLFGRGGNDLLIGNAGNDTLRGNDGNDRAAGGVGADVLFGGNGHDTLLGFAGSDKLNGNAGRDVLLGGKGKDTLVGDAGNDTLRGEGDADALYGGAGKDSLAGLDGSDRLFGNQGADFLTGGRGNDILAGGSGDDRLRGDQGRDTFVFGRGDSGDRILDFKPGTDLLVFEGLRRAGQAEIEKRGDNVLISFRRSDVLLEDTKLSDLKGETLFDLDFG